MSTNDEVGPRSRRRMMFDKSASHAGHQPFAELAAAPLP
jgi:hypothetical protein